MAGNWKMNVNHLEAIALVQKLAFALKDADYDAVDVAVFPPFTDLRSVQTLIDGDGYRIAYGAQDLSVHDSGAFTGEISGAMLAKLGCTYVLVGHSERREAHAEGDDVAAAKVRAAGRHDIIPIICVGEGLDVRQQGRQVAHVLEQAHDVCRVDEVHAADVCRAAACRGRGVIHHTNFKGRRTTQDILGFRYVLDAWQLDNNPIRTLLLYNGLGHAEFINPVMKCGDVLRECLRLHGRDRTLTQDTDHLQARTIGALCHL
jgi:hypothetical protein